MLRIGIDLGGSKIEIAAFDPDGNILLRHRVATPQGDYAATVETVAALVEEAETRLGAQGSVGIGMPGAESRISCAPGSEKAPEPPPKGDKSFLGRTGVRLESGLIKNANSTCLIGQPLRGDLERRLQREVRLANDANCFALSEAVDGAAMGAAVVFGVIIGTGCGAGVVVHGRVLEGANAIAGEWGHNPLAWPGDEERPGPACYCGKQGCVETWLSGPGLARDFLAHSGRSLTASDIALLAAAGDAEAHAAMARYEDRMARSLAQVINILDPDVIVLGGGLSNITRLYDNVPRLWARYVFSDHVATRLLPPVHGDSGGVRGAAWLWR